LSAAHPQSLATLTLASRLVSRAPDITRLLDKLDERRLVTRARPADDRRTVRVAITEQGLALLDKLAGQVRECHTRQLGHLSEADLRTLVELLRKARAPHESEEGPWR
jgi:DNA-binding MarR family transcriptional regulator